MFSQILLWRWHIVLIGFAHTRTYFSFTLSSAQTSHLNDLQTLNYMFSIGFQYHCRLIQCLIRPRHQTIRLHCLLCIVFRPSIPKCFIILRPKWNIQLLFSMSGNAFLNALIAASSKSVIILCGFNVFLCKIASFSFNALSTSKYQHAKFALRIDKLVHRMKQTQAACYFLSLE